MERSIARTSGFGPWRYSWWMPTYDDPPPPRPPEPDPSDCCGEGCANCVYDLYEAALARYEKALAEWCSRHQR